MKKPRPTPNTIGTMETLTKLKGMLEKAVSNIRTNVQTADNQSSINRSFLDYKRVVRIASRYLDIGQYQAEVRGLAKTYYGRTLILHEV